MTEISFRRYLRIAVRAERLTGTSCLSVDFYSRKDCAVPELSVRILSELH
jgi:hypothetical protein